MSKDPLTTAEIKELFPDLSKNLGNLIEEAGEVIIAARKCDRFGLYNYNPSSPDKRLNFEKLEQEIGDFLCTMRILMENDNIDCDRILTFSQAKEHKLKDWYNVERKDEPK